jgi:hypothetical protein
MSEMLRAFFYADRGQILSSSSALCWLSCLGCGVNESKYAQSSKTAVL